MESGRTPETKVSQRFPQRVFEAQLSWISSMALFFATVYVFLELDVLWVIFGISALSLYVLPIVTLRDPFAALPWEVTLLLAMPIFLHISEGSRILSGDTGWWNSLESLVFALSLSTIGFLLTIELEMFTRVRMNRTFSAFFVVMFTLAASGFWMLGEYLGDAIFGTNNLPSNEFVMTRLLWSMVGGVLMGILYASYLKAMSEKRRSLLGVISVWEVTSWKRS
ncbi:MAG: hypothetical protein MUO94_06390 [Thermoplasmata archaeon]|nr:hypothetical protein [Thermoplasmata archaeon]